MPRGLGIPPTPGGRSITRLLSTSANCPSRKNASRGSVAIQFGLPRPALRYVTCEVPATLLAALARKSLISNGLNPSYSRSFMMSMTMFLAAVAAANQFPPASISTITMPKMVSNVLPMAYGMP